MKEIINNSWFVKHKPTELDDYIFNNDTLKKNILKFTSDEFISGNLLFFGSPGNGKSSLVEILINKIAKNSNNFKRISSRSVDEIDDLSLFLRQAPYQSKQKIILIEEIDRLSKQAIIQLKDGLLEYFGNENCFIATTNNINKLDKGLKSRFINFKIELENISDLINRIIKILTIEQISYDIDEITSFINLNYKIGIRSLLTELQVNCNSGILKIKDILKNKNDEQEVVELLYTILKYISNENDYDKLLDIYTGKTKHFKPYYGKLLEILNNNKNLDYENILLELLNKFKDNISFYIISSNYIEDINQKTFKHLALLDYFFKCIHVLLDVKNFKR